MTSPLAAITNAMRDVAATGDLTRKVTLKSRALDDEDARTLATAFNTLTESIARFQREAAQKDRLSSLGRLSTVIAHEIRNPLMIIRASLTTLRRGRLTAAELREAVADIDEETMRLNRVVTDVLDFARPIRFELVRGRPECDLPRVGRGRMDRRGGRRGRAGPRTRGGDCRHRRRAAQDRARQRAHQRPTCGACRRPRHRHRRPISCSGG